MRVKRNEGKPCACGCGELTSVTDGVVKDYVHGHNPRGTARVRVEIVDRGFTSHCWEWIGAKHVAGYGMCRRNGKTLTAHRMMWEMENGRPPGKGMHIDHLCENKPCVNPAHLEEVTHAENLRRAAASRQARIGEGA